MYSTIKSITTAVVIMLFMVFSVNSFSQTSRFSISINSLTTNYNYGKSNSVLAPYKKNFTGLQAGFSYQAGITPMFSIVPELYFAMKGGTLNEKNPVTINKSTLRIYSLELPVMARVHCNNFYFNAGPYAAYNLGGRLKIDGSGTTPETITKITFGKDVSDFRRWDIGLLAGAGYNFNMKQSILTLDVRYGYGLTNISKTLERYNRSLNISLVLSKPYTKKQMEKKG